MLRRLAGVMVSAFLLSAVQPIVASSPVAAAPSAILCAHVKARGAETPKTALANYESKIGRKVAGHRYFEAWDTNFPNAAYNDDAAAGRIPFVGWKAQSKSGKVLWANIADGKQDALIRTRAQAVKAFGKPIYLSFHHEPERQPEFGNAADYVGAYRRIYNVFQSEGATNVRWVSGPLMVFTFKGSNGGPDIWYPGDAYVDYFGVNGYNWYPGRPYTKWRSFKDVFDEAYAYAVARNKPMVIYEHGVQEDTATPDAQRKAQWYRDALATVKNWPHLHAACYYHSNGEYGFPWWIDSTSQALQAYRELANDPVFGGDGSAPPPPPPPADEFDLSITKADSPEPVTAGNNLTYTITATNASTSPNDATGVTVRDAMPEGVSVVSKTPSQGSCSGTATVTCGLGTIAKGNSATVEIVVTPSAAGTITNTASVSGSGTDTNAANNSATESTTVEPGAGGSTATAIQVTNYAFTPTPATVEQGGTAEWVFNSSHTATDRSGMKLFDSGSKTAGQRYSFDFPWAGRYLYKCALHTTTSTKHLGTVAVPITASATDGSASAAVTWASGPPPTGFAFDVQVQKPNTTAWVDWNAGTTALSGVYTPDAGSGTYRFRSRLRNLSTAKASGWSPLASAKLQSTSVATSDLSIAKTDSADPATVGTNFNYTLSVANAGPQGSTGVSVTDALPSSVSFVSATPSQGSCSGTATVTCNLGSVASGGNATVRIVVTPNTATAISNTASVSGPNSDPNAANNSDTQATTVQAASSTSSDVLIRQTDSPDPVTVGSNVTYTQTVKNLGPDGATGVTVTDTLPSSVTLVSATPTEGSCSGTATVTCNLGSIASGATATITIVVRANAAGTIKNVASVSLSGTDPNTGNNRSTAWTTVNPQSASGSDLSIVQADSPDPVTAGNNVTYTLTVENGGPDDATGVTVTDTLPSDAAFVSARSTLGTCSGTAAVTCNLGEMASGWTATVSIVVTANTGGTITNRASVSSSVSDPNTANNSSSEATTVEGGAGGTATSIQVTNYAFNPTPAIVQQGSAAKWVFNSNHSATDRSGMNLFDSGSRSAGQTYSFTFPWAGRFAYKCALHAKTASTAHNGIIAVPIVALPEKGGPGTVFTITWAKAAPPSGFAFDVQVNKPNTTAWVDWKVGTTAMSAAYTPDAGTGGYRFRSRLRNLSTGKMSFWSKEDYFSYTK